MMMKTNPLLTLRTATLGGLLATFLSSCSNTSSDGSDNTSSRRGLLSSSKSDDNSGGGGPQAKGIDVSDNVGTVDWTQVKADGYTFALVKATDGVSLPSAVEYFNATWPKMKAAGTIRGAYHFYESADDPVAQANYFTSTLANAGGLQAGDLPPVLDFERATSGANVMKFLKQVEANTGRTPIIYVNESFASSYLTDPEFANYPLWLAEYKVTTPKVPATWQNAGKSWTFWQWNEAGAVAGVAGGSGQTDLDWFNGDASELASFIASTIR